MKKFFMLVTLLLLVTPTFAATTEYTGEKIALDFYDADIKNVLLVLKAVSKKNFAIDTNVTGRVNLCLDNPAPWDLILNLVLKMNQLDKVYIGNVIRIATIKTLKAEAELKRDKFATQPLITKYISINYSNAEIDIKPKIESILTERGRVSVDLRTNIIIITDVAEKIKKATEIIKNLDIVTPQVLIEAKIVETSTNFSRELGAQWGLSSGDQPISAMNATSMGGKWLTVDERVLENLTPIEHLEGTMGLGHSYGGNMAMNFPIASNAMSIGFNFAKFAGSPLLLNAKLLAMESRGEGEIISAPKIMTLNDKEAIIQQGLRYPYKVINEETGIATTAFEDIDLVLKVNPHVTSDNCISMSIEIKKADLGIYYPGGQSFTTKSASTEVLVNNGDTIIIGGIIKTTKNSGEIGVPWISKIPILGWFFKSQTKTNNKEDLLIFITPTIVRL